MLRFRGTVSFRDGTEQPFETGTAALAAYESYALRNGLPIGDNMPPTLGALVIAHFALSVDEGFDVWRTRVDGVELEADGLPPTLTEASTDS
jgi:hypothetical protein